MSRRRRAKKRIIAPDSVYESRLISMLVNRVMKDGKKSKVELYVGSGYLSQSTKMIRITALTAQVDVYDYKGAMRTIFPATLSSK